MRKLYTKFFAVTAIAAALVSCAKEAEIPTSTPVKPSEEGDFIMTVIASETKTVISAVDDKNYNVIWQAGDKLGVYEVGNGVVQEKAESYPLAAGGAEANFTVSFSYSDPGSPHKYAFVYPSSALGITEIESEDQYTVNLKQNQTFQAESFDASADALISELIESENRPSTVTTRFARIGATARMVLKCPTTDEAIESITFSTTEGNLSGYYTLDPASGKLSDGIVSGQQSLVLTPASTTNYSGEVVVWFRLAPITLSEQFTVTVRTSGHHDYAKTVDLAGASRTLEFADGKLTKFNVNMQPTAAEYVLVTTPADLTVGSQVIVAAPGDIANAMSTTQNANNRGSAAVTKLQNNTVISSPSDGVQIFTIATGTKANTIAFYTGSGYIYAASSGSNWLRTEDDLSDNSSWTVGIDSEGVATLIAQGESTRNQMRYNGSNNPPVFSAYAENSSVSTKVSIYKLAAPDNRAESGLGWDDTDGLGDVKNQELVLPALVNPNSLTTVTYSSSDETVATVAENSHTVTLLKEGETQIHAIFAGDEIYKPADVYYTLTVSDSRTDVTLSFGTASYELTVGSSDYNNFVGQAVTASPLVEVTYALSGASVGTLNTSTGAVALDGSTLGTATITASFAGNATYKAAEDATYTIVVSAASPSGTPGDETFDLSTNTYTTGTNSVTWTGESVVINNSGTNATNYLGGDANNRTSSRFYSGNALVITPNTDYTITSIVFTATSTNYANTLNGSTWTNGSSSVSGSTVTVTPTNGANAVSATVGGTCGFTSIVVNYIYSGVVVTKYAITVDNGIANGSVSADLSEAAEGATVTLTATPASGYALDAWNVYKTGEFGTKVTVSANAFTMPDYAVTVSASFAAVATISMNTTSIADVAAAGVSATAASAYNLLNGASNSDVTITCDGTVVTTASKNATAGSIDYTVASNSSNARNGWIKVKYGTEDPHEITVSQLAGESVTPTLQYTLDGTVTASGNAYATASTVTQSNIGWKVVGNTEQNPWRIGGKGITGENRAIYSTTAISANITQINVYSGATASGLTVNSMTISVHNSAADAESGSNAIATKTVTSGIASSTVTFDKEDNTSWAGKYYRIVYNVTRTSTSGNGYITFNNATFYGI